MHRILAVDDSGVLRRLIEVSLRPLDVQVVTVPTGKEACDRAIAAAPDLLLLDLGLPDMSGWDVLDFVQNEPALDGLPVVMLTGATDAADVEKADDAGVDEYLTKPFRPADLRRVVSDILGYQEPIPVE